MCVKLSIRCIEITIIKNSAEQNLKLLAYTFEIVPLAVTKYM